MFSSLFKKDPQQDQARQFYNTMVLAARDVSLYGPDGAPDSVDGRFEMIIMHAILVFRRLRTQGELAKAFNQKVFDIMFDDMDAALREMGTGDMSVGKKIKQMGEAFYGRAKVVDDALDGDDIVTALALILEKNLYAIDADNADHQNKPSQASKQLASYYYALAKQLDNTSSEALLEGVFPTVQSR